jgi:macrolide phosphotransferase
MAKSPLILAALAKDAVPQLDFIQAIPLSHGHGDRFDSAVLTATDGSHYVIRQARSANAELELDTELVALRALAPYRAHFPFEVTKFVGETKDGRGRRALVFNYVYGSPAEFQNVAASSPMVSSIANALAAIHSLPLSVVDNNGLPAYDAAATVKQRVAELDRAAQTGKVPAVLLNRWERALEDISLWRFQPVVIHGQASPAHFLENDQVISAVLGWDSLHIGDPAIDFAWIQGYGNPEFSYSALLEYERLRGGVDDNLRARAQLYAELAYANYLVGELAAGNAETVADAERFLLELVGDVENGTVGPIGPKPLGLDTFGDEGEFGNAVAVEPTLASASGFVDIAQNVVVDEAFAPEIVPVEVPLIVALDEEHDPAEVDPNSAALFEPVVDASYNHKNLFGETAPIPVVGAGSASTEPSSFNSDATAPIEVVAEDEKKTNGELF